MGADNLLHFIAGGDGGHCAETPIAVIDRPGATLKAANAKAAVYFKSARFRERAYARRDAAAGDRLPARGGTRALVDRTARRTRS
jgi:hypothetical protein